MVILDKSRHFYEALTRHNYFPNQKLGEEELPPCFSTRQFTPEIVELLVGLDDGRKSGYDQVEYSISRHNNVPRRLGLIHPKAYAHLAKTIADNQDDIEEKIKSNASMIKPEMHTDGRILIMNYEDTSDRINRLSNDSFAKRFRVHSDIASCFHTIYSHSIPWAVMGFDAAKAAVKKNRKAKKHWSECLDQAVSRSKRNETLGVPIGPATSSIVVELILACVDRCLNKKGFEFKRYIDDYVCHCDTHELAKQFVRELASELDKFKLNINLNKTKIIELPTPSADGWITRLAECLPTNYIDDSFSRRKYSLVEAQNYLDTAVRLNKETPDGSVLKYAIKTIAPNIHEFAMPSILNSILNLSWHFPTIIPQIDFLLSHENIDPKDYVEKLNSIIVENAKNNRSDGMAWCLYYLFKFKIPISQEAGSLVLESKDCTSLILLYFIKKDNQKIIDFAHEILNRSDYEKDQYWLLLYQLYMDEKIEKVYENDNAFELMKKYEVNFLPDKSNTSMGERYCDYINNPFSDFLFVKNSGEPLKVINAEGDEIDFLTWINNFGHG